jgi:hypothetical protein
MATRVHGGFHNRPGWQLVKRPSCPLVALDTNRLGALRNGSEPKGIALKRVRPTLVCISALICMAASTAVAQACTKTWTGGSGSWSEEGKWTPKGVPTSEDEVCITASGTYTVILAPYAGELGRPSAGDNVKSLTLGGSSGQQTIEIVGQSSTSISNEQVNEVSLNVSGTALINKTGALILNATGLGVPGSQPAKEKGGSATFRGTLLNYGQIETQAETSLFPVNKFEANVTNEPGASIQVNSGSFQEDRQGEGGYPWAATNEGTYTVAPGASVEMSPSFSGNADFTNDGSVVNDGSITMDGSNTTWTQSGGSVAGNAVVLRDGTTLADSAGAAQFMLDNGTDAVTGTIPAGQTVTVQGSPIDYGGETYFSSALSLANATLVNDGTLILNAPGSGESGGGSIYVQGGSIQNNGTLLSQVEPNASRRVFLEAGLTNSGSGTVELQSGQLSQGSGTPTTNEGLLTIAPDAEYFLNEGSTFTNSGTLSPQIASASSFGTFQLSSACCNGPSTFDAGGTVSPQLVGGFVPSVNEEFAVFSLVGGHFSGTFASGGQGFTVDYSHESYETPSPNYVGVVYGTLSGGGSPPPPPPSPSPHPSPSPLAHVISIVGGEGKLAVKMSCPAGGAGCVTATLKATVTEYLKGSRVTAIAAGNGSSKARTHKKVIVIATLSVSIPAGATKTFTLQLNAVGRVLLDRYRQLSTLVTVSSGASMLGRRTVDVRFPVKAKRKRKG